MTKKHNPRRSDPEWMELIAECRRSGLSDDCWCKNNGIPVSTFYNAVNRLRKKACHIPPREKHGIIDLTASQDVVPVDIIRDPPEASSLQIRRSARNNGPIQTEPCSAMEILIGDTVIRIPNGTDPQLLSHVFRLIGGMR